MNKEDIKVGEAYIFRSPEPAAGSGGWQGAEVSVIEELDRANIYDFRVKRVSDGVLGMVYASELNRPANRPRYGYVVRGDGERHGILDVDTGEVAAFTFQYSPRGMVLGYMQDLNDQQTSRRAWSWTSADKVREEGWAPPAEPTPESDPVNHPNHYVMPDGAEVVSISKWLTSLAGQAVQYVARSSRIDGTYKGNRLEDLDKAILMLQWERDRVAEELGRAKEGN